MIDNKEIDELITKYLCGEANANEAMQIADWIELSDDNKAYFTSMQNTINLVDQREASTIDKQKAWTLIDKKISNKSSLQRKLLVGLIVLTIFGFITYNHYQHKPVSKEIKAVDVVIQETLPDASSFKLEKGSTLTLSNDYNITSRHLTLQGNAEFNVKHDESKPFVVQTDQLLIEDIGTIFTIQNQPNTDTVYVVVKEGIVRLYHEDGSEIFIKAGDEAWYIKSQKKIIVDIDTKVIKFDFQKTKLSKVVETLNGVYRTQIRLSSPGLGSCELNAQFFEEDIANIVTIIAETLNLRFEYDNGVYKLEGKTCN